MARAGLAGLVAGRRADYTVAANWKIIMENFQECYRCSTIQIIGRWYCRWYRESTELADML